MQNTTVLNKQKAAAQRKWYLIDASNIPLGRLAVEIADLLRGKRKPIFTPNQDCGDFVVVINSDKIVLTGHKEDNEIWYNHSGYIKTGLRARNGKTMLEHYSNELLRRSVWGMLPKNKLSRALLKKLYIFKNEEHNKLAQQPIPYEFKDKMVKKEAKSN